MHAEDQTVCRQDFRCYYDVSEEGGLTRLDWLIEQRACNGASVALRGRHAGHRDIHRAACAKLMVQVCDAIKTTPLLVLPCKLKPKAQLLAGSTLKGHMLIVGPIGEIFEPN